MNNLNLIRENRYVGGDVLDVDIYAVKKTARSRAARSRPTSETQELLNRKNSEKRLRRTLHLNFTPGRDFEIAATFDRNNLPETDEDAEKAVKNYLRRLKRLYEKTGEELKYVVCMGGRDGGSRRHAHITVSGSEKIPRRKIAEAWKLGTCNVDVLQDKDDKMFAPLAGYLAGTKQLDRRQAADGKGKKRWWGSRNLKKPKAAERTGYLSHKAVRALISSGGIDTEAVEEIYRGYRVVDFEVFESPLFGTVYINLLMKRKK